MKGTILKEGNDLKCIFLYFNIIKYFVFVLQLSLILIPLANGLFMGCNFHQKDFIVVVVIVVCIIVVVVF